MKQREVSFVWTSEISTLYVFVLFSSIILLFSPNLVYATCGPFPYGMNSSAPAYHISSTPHKLTDVFHIFFFGSGYCPTNLDLSPDHGSVVIVNPDSASNGLPGLIPLKASMAGLSYVTYRPGTNTSEGIVYFVIDNSAVGGSYVSIGDGVTKPYTTLQNLSHRNAVQALLTKYGYITIRFNNSYDANILSASNTETKPAPSAGILSFIDSATTLTQLKITWDLSKLDTRSDVFNNFYIERREGAGTFVNHANPVHWRTQNTFTDTGLKPGTEYAYRIRQYLGNVYTPYSNIISTFTPILKATPTDFTATLDKNTGIVTFRWKDNSMGEAGYFIYRIGSDGPAFAQAAKADATTATYNLDSSRLDLLEEKFYVRAVFPDASESPRSDIAIVSTCVPLSGSGPIKIVFMRGVTANSSTLGNISGFVDNSTRIIQKGFGELEPFKTYLNHFSFFIDLHKDDEFNGGIPKIKAELSERSSCKDADLYIHYNQFGNNPNSPGMGIIDMDILPFSEESFTMDDITFEAFEFDYDIYTPFVEMHETGHALGGLSDEYLRSRFGSIWNFRRSVGYSSNPENCSSWPPRDFRSSINNLMYGARYTRGCTYVYTSDARSPADIDPRPYYRPSSTGIMNTDLYGPDSVNKFNVISCGYLIAAFKKEPLDRNHAQKYWPDTYVDSAGVTQEGCMGMARRGAVIMDGIPPVNPTPERVRREDSSTTNSFGSWLMAQVFPVPDASYSANPGSTFTIEGTGFSDTENAVQFTNTTTGQQFEIIGIPSDGSSLTFIIPNNVSPGIYTVKIGAFNSEWSESFPFTIGGEQQSETLSTTNPVILTLTPPGIDLSWKNPVILSWSFDTSQISQCTGTTDMPTPPPQWNTNISSSGTIEVPPQSWTFTMSCDSVAIPGTPASKILKTVQLQIAPEFAAPGDQTSQARPVATILLDRMITYILNPLVYLLIAFAVIVFLWGAVEFVANADDQVKRSLGKKHLIWGIIGLVIIVSVYGFMNFIQNSLIAILS